MTSCFVSNLRPLEIWYTNVLSVCTLHGTIDAVSARIGIPLAISNERFTRSDLECFLQNGPILIFTHVLANVIEIRMTNNHWNQEVPSIGIVVALLSRSYRTYRIIHASRVQKEGLRKAAYTLSSPLSLGHARYQVTRVENHHLFRWY